jgi:hypothetical protein
LRAWDNASDLRNAALGKEISLRNFAEWERKVRTDFWSKPAVTLSQPFFTFAGTLRGQHERPINAALAGPCLAAYLWRGIVA